jgi:hypothetical protein
MWPAASALRSVDQHVVVRLSGATFVTMVKTADLRNRDHTACGRADQGTSGDSSLVSMVEAADFTDSDHVTVGDRLHTSRRRRVFRQREMGP